ncbi:Lsr2 family protein [Schaalia sp. ZJ405]|uniref:histone-like nucleoid-structuring protein Lsr2 n=1 Tax=unclassified Schaalia TaxID=2691889 RepID=UPI0013ECEC44|nr:MULTISPECIES: Lsr2 family protein [unclassified Schaalia]QPK81507.1 Lsr2 family protein [Schaalia sp. ZJ405]
MKKTIVELIDDIDGTVAERTVPFAFNGVTYEIDLSSEHIAEFTQAMERWIGAGRRTGGRVVVRSGQPVRQSEASKIREWAKDNGVEVNERGRIPAAIVAQYRASQS